MITKLDRSGTAVALRALLAEVVGAAEVRSILILACDGNGYVPEEVDAILAEVSVPVFGGLFPQVLYGGETLERGVVVAGLSSAAHVQVIRDLSDVEADYGEQIVDVDIAQGERTMVVFVDGLARRISSLIESLFDVYGLQFNYIGGGAGSLSFQQKPCLFTNEGLLQDCAVLAMVEMASGVGVCHGWVDVAGPYQVTESDRNVIQSLDWMPAFEVYRGAVREHSGREVTVENFFEVAKSYPFGITKLGAEKVVRDPLMVQGDEGLVCVGEVPQGSYVHILTGDVCSLVAAAGRALVLGEQSFSRGSALRTTLFIDCISRALFLGGEFGRELEAVQREGAQLIGALTLGEIANSRTDYLEFYNKTSVVGVLGG